MERSKRRNKMMQKNGDRETIREELSGNIQRVHGTPITEVH